MEFATRYDWSPTKKKYILRGSRGGKPYVVSIWPRFRPDPDHEEVYEKYCYAKMILHHPFKNPNDLLEGFATWTAAFHTKCLGHHHIHQDDTLPHLQEATPLEDDESDTESLQEDDDPIYQPEWMQEAGRCPEQAVESNLGNLGSRDMDLEYDWLANSPNQEIITAASQWLSNQVKESPNDDVQVLPEAHYSQLKGEQRLVFLQVMAYFKKLQANDGSPKPPPLHINVDGTAGTGKSFLIWAISNALRVLYGGGPNDKDPVVRLAPTGISAFGIRG